MTEPRTTEGPDDLPPRAEDAPVTEPSGVQLAVGLGTPVLQSTTLAIRNYTSDTVTVEYTGLPGNQPHSYGNFVAIWEDSIIPWTVPPITSKAIPQDRPTATVTLSGLTVTRSTYIVGYGVGAGTQSICASAVLSAGGLRGAPTAVQMSLGYVGTDTVIVHYDTLSGYLPATNHNWIGLWRGYISPYAAPAPVGAVQIPSDVTSASVAIDGVELAINSPYTLVYFMGDPEEQRRNTKAAAILTFETAGAMPQTTRSFLARRRQRHA
jgi:hypothetical protein